MHYVFAFIFLLRFCKKVCTMCRLYFKNMAVPKKKTAKSYSKTRHTHYMQSQQKRIQDETKVVECKECGAPKLSHRVCKECGKYRGRQIVAEKESSETTRIMA